MVVTLGVVIWEAVTSKVSARRWLRLLIEAHSVSVSQVLESLACRMLKCSNEHGCGSSRVYFHFSLWIRFLVTSTLRYPSSGTAPYDDKIYLFLGSFPTTISSAYAKPRSYLRHVIQSRYDSCAQFEWNFHRHRRSCPGNVGRSLFLCESFRMQVPLDVLIYAGSNTRGPMQRATSVSQVERLRRPLDLEQHQTVHARPGRSKGERNLSTCGLACVLDRHYTACSGPKDRNSLAVSS